tara:strand:+ start:115 stop:384 length:270 start_codon:yes stop_codon:yes gene_type:complete
MSLGHKGHGVLEGLVIPCDWDGRSGEVIDIHIALDGETNIRLVKNRHYQELLKNPGSSVTLKGHWEIGNRFAIDQFEITKQFQIKERVK